MLTWVYLIIGGVLEPFWVIALEKSRGFKDLKWTVAAVVLIIASPYFLSLAMRDMPMGTAYAVWTGMGAVFTLVAGAILYKEKIAPIRMVFVAMVLCGVVGLQVVGA